MASQMNLWHPDLPQGLKRFARVLQEREVYVNVDLELFEESLVAEESLDQNHKPLKETSAQDN